MIQNRKHNLPRFITAESTNGLHTFKIMQVVASFLVLEDDKKKSIYYDTLNEEFLTLEQDTLPYKVISPKEYKLKKKHLKPLKF